MSDLTKEQQEELKAGEEEAARIQDGRDEEAERQLAEENIRRDRAGLPSVEDEQKEQEAVAKAQEAEAKKAEKKDEKTSA
jgi:hypothetical protein